MECLIDNDNYEGSDFVSFENKKITSLEVQVCNECGDTIHPGTEYWNAIGFHDNENDETEAIEIAAFNAQTCQICEGLKRFLCYNVYGNLYEDLHDGIHYDNDPYKVENQILTSISYTELQWLMRFDVLDLDNDMDDDEE